VGREETSRAIWAFEGFPSSYDELLDASQRPVGPEVLLELAGQAGLSERSLVADVACYDASTSLPLVERFGCRLVGVDLGAQGFEARRKADDPDAGARLWLVQGRLEEIPLATGSCDLVWCRDALSVADCAGALRELARVARPGGTVLLHTTCATPLLEPAEREALFADLALDPTSMDAAAVEREAAGAGLAVQEHVLVGSQWLQHRLEKSAAADDLLKLARLTQWPERYAAAWGETWYRRILRWQQWPVYQALGKLQGHVWVFRAGTAGARV
jgi:ubiquinone/menaquinone biosynthesis C-methylase UbiE